MNIFKVLSRKHQLSSQENKIGLISDSCSAITPFETIPLSKDISNFFAMASSSFDEKSKSHGYDIELNQPKSDDFSFYVN